MRRLVMSDLIWISVVSEFSLRIVAILGCPAFTDNNSSGCRERFTGLVSVSHSDLGPRL